MFKKPLPERLCRNCHVPLLTDAEYKLGIHIRCVWEKEEEKKAVVVMRNPRYGRAYR